MKAIAITLMLSLLSCACVANGSANVACGGERDSRPLYVRVRAGSPDAVMVAAPSPWADVVAQLEYAQPLVSLGERNGAYTLVRTRDLGVNIEGWVVESIIRHRRPPDDPALEIDPVDAARNMYPHEEFRDDPDLQGQLLWLDDYERGLDHQRGGDSLSPDSEIIRARLKAFGASGGLIRD